MIEFEDLGKANAPFFAEYQRAFEHVLRGGRYVLGDSVRAFEADFAAYCGVPHCIGVASGLDALTLALKACNFKAGDEVIVPSNTFIATVLSVLHAGLTPVLVEPDIRTYNINPGGIAESITARTVAVVVVHLYGKCCAMPQIMSLARQHGLKVLEDCSQAHGARIGEQKAGTFGEAGAFSFYPTKNLGALGDAGGVVTQDGTIKAGVESLRNYGSAVKYRNDMVGYNSRLDEVQAAFLRVKLKRLDEINAHKRQLAALYLQGLKDDFIKPVVEEGYFDVYHIFNVRHAKRDQLREYLFAKGIKTEIHYPVPPHQQQAMQGILDHYSCPVAEDIHKTTLSLPVSYGQTPTEICQVIDFLNKF
jgi:dTDP-4-amino-4,6-dideoxygalactose transaminase